MSYCRQEGKDRVIFVTEEDHKLPEPASAENGDDNKDANDGVPEGAVLPNGEINWDCPCLGDMPHGPCAEEFRAAFSCFIASTEEQKGSDCIEKFVTMTECTRRFPDLYPDSSQDEAEQSESSQPEAAGKSETSQPEAAGKSETSQPESAEKSESAQLEVVPVQEKPEPAAEASSEVDSKKGKQS